MYKFLTKNGQLIALLVGAVISIGSLLIILGGIDDFNILPKEEKGTTTIFDFGLKAAIALIIIAALAALLFGIYHLATNPKGAVKFLAGLVILGVVLGITYAMSSGFVGGPKEALALESGKLSATASQWINAGIKTTLGLLGGGALILILLEIRNLFK
jgi:hypothetical protein